MQNSFLLSWKFLRYVNLGFVKQPAPMNRSNISVSCRIPPPLPPRPLLPWGYSISWIWLNYPALSIPLILLFNIFMVAPSIKIHAPLSLKLQSPIWGKQWKPYKKNVMLQASNCIQITRKQHLTVHFSLLSAVPGIRGRNTIAEKDGNFFIEILQQPLNGNNAELTWNSLCNMEVE